MGAIQRGGYRTSLWNKFVADGLKVDFVGSSNGPASLGDKDHEGHRGFRMIGLPLQSMAGWTRSSRTLPC